MNRCVRGALAALAASLAVSAAAAPLPEATPEDVGISSQRLERITQTMQRICPSSRI